MAKMTQFTASYAESHSINYQKVEFQLSATYDLEEGDDPEAAMKEARRRLVSFVRFSVDRAAERYDTDGSWRAKYLAKRKDSENAPDGPEAEERREPSQE